MFPPDVPVVDLTTGCLTQDFYEIVKGLERLGLLDLADVATTAPANTQVLIWDDTAKLWKPGAN
jgi:hypothetical protein